MLTYSEAAILSSHQMRKNITQSRNSVTHVWLITLITSAFHYGHCCGFLGLVSGTELPLMLLVLSGVFLLCVKTSAVEKVYIKTAINMQDRRSHPLELRVHVGQIETQTNVSRGVTEQDWETDRVGYHSLPVITLAAAAAAALAAAAVCLPLQSPPAS